MYLSQGGGGDFTSSLSPSQIIKESGPHSFPKVVCVQTPSLQKRAAQSEEGRW